MLAIETGRVEVSILDEHGRRMVLEQLGPGDLVGEMALLDGGHRSADATASGPVTGLLLTLSDVHGFLVQHPEVMFSLLVDLATKLRAANALVEDRTIRDGAARLARCLLRLAERWGERTDGGPLRFRETFSQGDLGRMAGLSRENVNRRLSSWTRLGLVSYEGTRLVIAEPRIIERISAGMSENTEGTML